MTLLLLLAVLEGFPVQCERSADGSACVFLVAPGRYRLSVTTHGYAPKKLAVTSPGTVDVPLD